jgi:L-histidine Nalpha-methyltransferase / hercynylcysteine S-oxide synthase
MQFSVGLSLRSPFLLPPDIYVCCRFILNGLLQANEILGEQLFKLEDWKVIGEYVYDAEGGRHQAFYSPIRNIHFKDIDFKAGERVQVEQSLKYSADEALQLWNGSGLYEVDRWSASSDNYSKYRSASP